MVSTGFKIATLLHDSESQSSVIDQAVVFVYWNLFGNVKEFVVKQKRLSFRYTEMGSVSCEGEDGCDESESMRDRFSELELKVVHHILSFFTITELTSFGCVSRRCREIYLSTPSLKFEHFSDSNTNSCFSRLRLISSLDRYFLNRGFNQIVSFRFCWEKHYPDEDSDEGSCFCVNEHFRLMTWINNVVRCNVEVMHLEVCSYDENDLKIELVLPHCVFACGSLRSLVIQMSCTVIIVPTTLSSNLRFLELRDVEVEEGFFKWISSSCKYIEELVVQDVQSIENITIQSSSLTSFVLAQHYGQLVILNISGEKLESISIDWTFGSGSTKSLNISAPNLEYLHWDGNLVNHPNLGKLERLEEALILLEPTEADIDNRFEVVCSLSRVEDLTLNAETIKALLREGLKTPPFDNVSNLRMHIANFVDELVPAIVSLFTGMPKLCTLHFGNLYMKSMESVQAYTSGFNMEFWKLQNLAFIYTLKWVTMELSDESNEIELARYMLDHALCLKRMVIICSSQHVEKVTMKLNISKIVSSAVVVFQEYR